MSEVILVAIIAAIPGSLAAVLSFLNREKIKEVHVMMNSRFTEMLRVAVAAAEARGELAAGARQETNKK
jgi:hypothetical protein